MPGLSSFGGVSLFRSPFAFGVVLVPSLTTVVVASSSIATAPSAFRGSLYFVSVATSWVDPVKMTTSSSSFSTFANSPKSGGRGGGGRGRLGDRESSKGHGGGGKDRIDALGRLLTRILRHMAAELNLNIRSDGYVKVQDLLKLSLTTFANIPLRSHSVDEIREAVRRDNKQRFSLMEENRELFIRANQGHSVKAVETESLLKPIYSAKEIPVCVHGTYKKNLESILKSGLKRMTRLHVHFSCGLPTDGEVISGMRRDVNMLIFLDVKKALEEGMKIFISDNKVILTEGFDGTVPVQFFEKIVSWPDNTPIPFLEKIQD
ncbi:hypothetical protein Droror1_Dr00016024 [Drosera rotundifolia]